MPAQTATRCDPARFVGTWRLESITLDGGVDPRRGPRPTGVLHYDATGRVAAQIMPDRVRPAWPPDAVPPDEAARDALYGYTAYFGTYTVDEARQTMTHHRDGCVTPGLVGVDAVRRFVFTSPDRIVFTPVENPRVRLTWVRVSPCTGRDEAGSQA